MQTPKRKISTSTSRPEFRTVFRVSRARKVIRFVSRCYKSIGLQLPRFQKRLIARLYGNCDAATGFRRFRKVYYSTPRKNAKSTLAAALSLYHLFADGEPNPRIYLAATTLEQTAETFEILLRMCAAMPTIDAQTKTLNSQNRKQVFRVVDGRERGYILAMTSRGSKEGKNPSVVIMDEFCDWRELHRPLWKSMTMGSFARKQPLFFITTTAGDDTATLCKEQYTYARKVLAGEVKAPSFLPYIYEVDPKKWDDPDEQIRANPLVAEGFIPTEAIAAEFADVSASPSELAKFQNKRLNMWVGSSVGFLPMDKWRAITRTVTDADLVGCPCVGGLDLARSTDFNSLVLLFELPDGVFAVRAYFWLPKGGLMKREKVDGKPYRQWEADGLLITSPGEKVNHRLIFEKIQELQSTFSLREIAFDRWGSAQIIEQLEGLGLTVTPHGQGFKDMALPMDTLLSLTVSGEILHCGNDILDWMASNLNAKEDDAGNRKPAKGTRGSKIDGMSALLMALGVTMRGRAGRYGSALAEMFPGEAA